MNTILSIAINGIDHSFHEPYASLMKGLVYGLPIQIDPHLKQDIIKSGLAHLVVLSGTNITLLTQLSEKLFCTASRKTGLLLQLIFLGVFVYVVGPQAPLIRAVYMHICTVICILTGRPSYMLWNLILTILAVAILQPEWISSISFQLSVFATLGIIVWSAITSHFEKKLHPFIEIFLESWVVFAITAPISMWYFKSISLTSPLSTALVSWLIIPLMIVGFAISASYVVFPPLTTLLALPTQMGLQYIVFVIQITSKLPLGYIFFK